MSVIKNRRYGQWAGNPNGIAEDDTRCREEVWPRDGWMPYQCRRKRGHGPKGEFCKQHARRLAEIREKEEEPIMGCEIWGNVIVCGPCVGSKDD